jgi:hypothetical protein
MKFEGKLLGPFEVLLVGSNQQYCKLLLPDSGKIYPVFNIDLLERYKWINPKKQMIEIEADGEAWVMESIIPSGLSDDNPKQHVFLIKWNDCTQEENT